MLYSTILFIHIFGALIMFSAVVILLMILISMLNSKNNETLKVLATIAVKADTLLPISVLLILVPGLYLTITSWGFGSGWIDLSLLLLIIMTIMGPKINLRRLKAIQQAVNEEKTNVPSHKLRGKITDRVLWNSCLIMSLQSIAIVFLMTVKPHYLGSLITIAVFVVLALILVPIILKGKVSVSK